MPDRDGSVVDDGPCKCDRPSNYRLYRSAGLNLEVDTPMATKSRPGGERRTDRSLHGR